MLRLPEWTPARRAALVFDVKYWLQESVWLSGLQRPDQDQAVEQIQMTPCRSESLRAGPAVVTAYALESIRVGQRPSGIQIPFRKAWSPCETPEEIPVRMDHRPEKARTEPAASANGGELSQDGETLEVGHLGPLPRR